MCKFSFGFKILVENKNTDHQNQANDQSFTLNRSITLQERSENWDGFLVKLLIKQYGHKQQHTTDVLLCLLSVLSTLASEAPSKAATKQKYQKRTKREKEKKNSNI